MEWKIGISITLSPGGSITKTKTQVYNAPAVTEESIYWSAVSTTIFDMQAFVEEHGTLLNKKGDEKSVTMFIK